MNYEFKEEENKKAYERCQTTIDGITSLIHILGEHNGVYDPDFQNVLKWFDILIKDAEDIKNGSFQSHMFIRQSEYVGLNLSDPDSTDCQDVIDYILSKDSRFTVLIEPLDKVYMDHWKDNGVELTVKWGIENEAH